MDQKNKNGIIVRNLINDVEVRNEFYHEYIKNGLNNDSEFLNKLKPSRCPYCGEMHFKECGQTNTNLNLYECDVCHGKFSVITNTVFDGLTTPIRDWHLFLDSLFKKNYLTRNSYQVFPQEDHEKFIALAKILATSNWGGNVFRGDEVEIHLFTYPNRDGNIEKVKNIKPENNKNYIIAFASDNKKLSASIVGASYCNPLTILNRFKHAIPSKTTLVTRPLNSFDLLIEENNLKSKIILGTKEQLLENYQYFRGVKLEEEFYKFLKVYKVKGMNLLLEYFMKVFEAVQRNDFPIERKISLIFAMLINNPLLDEYTNYLMYKDKCFYDKYMLNILPIYNKD